MISNHASTTVCLEEAMRLADTLLHIDQLKHNEDGMMETTFGRECREEDKNSKPIFDAFTLHER